MIKIGSDSGNSLIGQIQEKQNNLFEKLASGKKINDATDGAAAQQIIDRLTSEVEGILITFTTEFRWRRWQRVV